jgi:hypothetical protein
MWKFKLDPLLRAPKSAFSQDSRRGRKWPHMVEYETSSHLAESS